MKPAILVVIAVSIFHLSTAQACKYCYNANATGGESRAAASGEGGGGTRMLKAAEPKNALDKDFFKGAQAAAATAPVAKEPKRERNSDFETETVYGAP